MSSTPVITIELASQNCSTLVTAANVVVGGFCRRVRRSYRKPHRQVVSARQKVHTKHIRDDQNHGRRVRAEDTHIRDRQRERMNTKQCQKERRHEQIFGRGSRVLEVCAAAHDIRQRQKGRLSRNAPQTVAYRQLRMPGRCH